MDVVLCLVDESANMLHYVTFVYMWSGMLGTEMSVAYLNFDSGTCIQCGGRSPMYIVWN